MEIAVLNHRDPHIETLLALWKRSVIETHTFLTRDEIQHIKEYVPAALQHVPTLIVSKEKDTMLGFIGLDGQKIEMLFIDPTYRHQGIGKALIQYAITHYDAHEVTVNEQNEQAVGFYEYLGFKPVHYSPVDEQGQPYPIITMQR